MDDHIASIFKSVHYHTHALHHILSSTTQDVATTVITALVGSRVDYANSVLYGTTEKNIFTLQKAQNLLARIVLNTHQSSSNTLLQQLLWLPVEYSINFKIANNT